MRGMTAKLSKIILRLSCLIVAAGLVAGCDQSGQDNQGASSVSAANGDNPAVVTELIVKDVVIGDGAAIEPGQMAVMHYTGWLYEPTAPDSRGRKFDSSLDRNESFPFQLGAGRVIRGWDEGIAGMLVGGKRELIIPPAMAYGSRGAGGVIPPDATLLFEVELLGVQ
jgi:FKBP-type peptidyl-prolyl cis-trans isomerase FkpA